MEIYEIVTYFTLLLLLFSAARVVTTSNVIHAAISLVFTLALTATLFLLLSITNNPYLHEFSTAMLVFVTPLTFITLMTFTLRQLMKNA